MFAAKWQLYLLLNSSSANLHGPPLGVYLLCFDIKGDPPHPPNGLRIILGHPQFVPNSPTKLGAQYAPKFVNFLIGVALSEMLLRTHLCFLPYFL